MAIGLSSVDSTKELAALAHELDRLYDTERTNALIEMVNEVVDELRQLRKCQCCPNEATRHLCDKPHQW
jgi:hypothetical protein